MRSMLLYLFFTFSLMLVPSEAMNDTELDNNFLFACLKYANDSSFGVDFQLFESQLIFGPDELGNEQISYWDHPSSQPDRETLMGYNVSDLAGVSRIFNIAVNIQPVLKALSIADAAQVATQEWTPQFLMASNIDYNQPMIFINDTWYYFSLSTSPSAPA